MFYSLKNKNLSTRVDYYQLAKLLVGQDRTLVRAYYHNGAFDAAAFPDKAKSQQSFYDSLDRTPYLEVRLGRIIQYPDGRRTEKGVDVRMAADLVYYAARDFYDTAIVITEDQDFAPALAIVKELGKHVEIVTFGGSTTKELMRVADKPIDLMTLLKTEDGAKVFPLVPEGPAQGPMEALDSASGVPVEGEDNAGNR